MPVNDPAINPATNPAALASKGLMPDTSITAATDAPNVIDPSAVMSGKWKMRKLINTPSASRDKINPMVIAPIRRVTTNPFLVQSPAFRLLFADGTDIRGKLKLVL